MYTKKIRNLYQFGVKKNFDYTVKSFYRTFFKICNASVLMIRCGAQRPQAGSPNPYKDATLNKLNKNKQKLYKFYNKKQSSNKQN